MFCASCGQESLPSRRYCANCGAQLVQPGAAVGVAAAPTTDLLLSPARLIAFCIVTSGLYLFYWSYLTWRQLADTTREVHYPVWHALTLAVPIYGLYRFARHLTVIDELALRTGVAGVSVGLGVTMLIIGNILGSASVVSNDVGLNVALSVAVVALTTVLLLMAQASLNASWNSQYTERVTDAKLHIVEFLLAGVGLLAWWGTFYP